MLNKLSFNLAKELNESETKAFKIKKKVFMEGSKVRKETLIEDASSALEKVISGDEVYFRDPEGQAMVIRYTNNYPEPEEYDEGYKEEYGGSADELEYAKKAAEEGNVWEALEVDEEGNPTGVSIALFYGEEELKRMLEDLREVNIIKKLEEGENTFKYVYYPDEIKKILLDNYHSDNGFESEEEFNDWLNDELPNIKRIESESEISMISQPGNDSFPGFKSGKVRTILKDGRAFISTEPEIALINAIELTVSDLEESASVNSDLKKGKEDRLASLKMQLEKDGAQLANDEKEAIEEEIAKLENELQECDKPLKESWTDAYKQFDAIVNKYLKNSNNWNTKTVEKEIEELYSKHKGESDWDEAYRRWHEFETEEDFNESAKSLKEESYEDNPYIEIENALDNAGFAVSRYTDEGILTKNIGWVLSGKDGSTVYLTCDGTWLDESAKSLKEGYSEKLGGDPEDFVSDVETIKAALEAIDTNSFGTHLAQQMIMDWIDTCDYQIERGKRLASGNEFYSESEKSLKEGFNLDKVQIIDTCERRGQPIALINLSPIKDWEEYVVAFGYTTENNEVSWSYGYYYYDEESAKEAFEKVKAGGNLSESEKTEKKPIVEAAETEVKDLQVIKEQGNIYMLEDKSEGTRYIVGENYNLSEGEIENAEIYDSKEEADKDYLNRCDIIKNGKEFNTNEDSKEDTVTEDDESLRQISEEKINNLKMMDNIARKVNDEDLFYGYWLSFGVPDEATEEDYQDIAKEDYEEIEQVFKKLMKKALEDGLYNASEEELEFARKYEPEIKNIK